MKEAVQQATSGLSLITEVARRAHQFFTGTALSHDSGIRGLPHRDHGSCHVWRWRAYGATSGLPGGFPRAGPGLGEVLGER